VCAYTELFKHNKRALVVTATSYFPLSQLKASLNRHGCSHGIYQLSKLHT